MIERNEDTRPEVSIPTLFPREADLEYRDVPEYRPEQPPSSIRELQRLARVKTEGEIGRFGPSLAAIALERPGGNISPELRKYETLFGRDSLRVALDVLPMYPLLLHATIHELATYQGEVTHLEREEEPGRIIHEYRTPDDPVGKDITEKFGWQWPYYGSVDATPQLLHAMYRYMVQTGSTSLLSETNVSMSGQKRTLGEVYKRALGWIENRLNANPQGFLEYHSSIPAGIENQVWRDSWDGYFHADGTLANHQKGIASVEVQQLAFDVLREASKLHRTVFGDAEKAKQLMARATTLRERFLEWFWVDEKGGYFALALDRDEQNNPRPMKIRTSNMGHLLNSQLLAGEPYRHYREAVVRQLFSPEMLCPSGIRTLASDEVRYRPGAYHNGSVWLWDTYHSAEGLRRHGYYGLANYLAEKIPRIINVTQRFPEYVRGEDSEWPLLNPRVVEVTDTTSGRRNRIEQPPQEVQAWSVAAEVRRSYYSQSVPDSAYDARAVALEDTILGSL